MYIYIYIYKMTTTVLKVQVIIMKLNNVIKIYINSAIIKKITWKYFITISKQN